MFEKRKLAARTQAMVDDIDKAAVWIAAALTDSGYRADFSVDSLAEIDRFFDRHSKDGVPVPGGLLSENLGQRTFALAAYTGEVIRRSVGGEWHPVEDNPDDEINFELHTSPGQRIWPMQRVIKRFKNGPEDSIYSYGLMIVEGSTPAPG